MMEHCRGKLAWPELLGKAANEAMRVISAENPFVKGIQIVKQGSHVTMDYRCDRVRLWVDDNQIVIAIPKVG